MNFDQLQNAFKSSYENNKQSRAKTNKPSLSGKRAKVFTDHNEDAYIVHKGTNSTQDVFSDIGSIFGNNSSNQLWHAKQVRKQVEDKYAVL